MKIFLYPFFFLSFLMSCSLGTTKINPYDNIAVLLPKDYVDYLASTGDDYLNYVDTKVFNLNKNSLLYLEKLYDRLVSNNEIFFQNHERPRFHIIKDKRPFIFSLPGARFFLSSGLIQKYLKNEELFIAAFAVEVVKSKRQIYEKRTMIPLGFYSTEKMIQLTRVPTEFKNQLNEWGYLVLKRSGFDPAVSLNWIQVQNRNILDFSMYLGDATSISKEEHNFKNFLVKESLTTVERKTLEGNSSKEFYQLMNQIASIE